MNAGRAAALAAAIVAGVVLGLGVHALGTARFRAEQLSEDLVGGVVLALVVWIGLVTLRRSHS